LSSTFIAAFHQGLGESGYVEGRNMLVEYRWAEGRIARARRLMQEPDHRHRGLLRAHGERPRRRAAEEGDELAPSHHSITSSARI
jgi:putative tryptophan/tyrosine transport system substrate-binding protein